MPYYTKRPITIEARQYTGANADEIVAWICQSDREAYKGIEGFLLIETLEGRMKANIGDMIIKGVKGEFYPCKKEIFDLTYEVKEL